VGTWTVRLGIAALLIVAAVTFGVRAKGQMYDFDVYLTAGARVVAGESLYRAEDGHWQYKYLPAFACVIAPLSLLPPVVARALWFALSIGLLLVLIDRALGLLPERRMTARVLVGLTVLAMGKFYVREIGLGQANLLLAVCVLAALDAGRRGRDPLAGVLLAAATAVKPYAIIFLPYLLARRRTRAAAWFVGGLTVVMLLPVVRYGVGGNIDLLRGLWEVVTASTAPNLAGQDNVSIAGMYAGWFGVGPVASCLAAVTALAVLAACAWVLRRRGPGPCPEYLDAAVLLFLIPLLSPQGWDYVLLITTPAVMLLLDRMEGDGAPLRVLLLACLLIVGLSLWDVMGRDWYRAFMMARVVSVCALVELALVLRLRVLRTA
jgi:hypothetical protein